MYEVSVKGLIPKDTSFILRKFLFQYGGDDPLIKIVCLGKEWTRSSFLIHNSGFIIHNLPN